MNTKIKELLGTVYEECNLKDAPHRRQVLNDSMLELNSQGKNCFSCEGICCTFAHNSMLITPIEALELLAYLAQRERLTPELIRALKTSVSEYRLDKELNIGAGKEFRRNYTCPFYNNGSLGCSISPNHKPYGCLGFNPYEKEVSVAGKCKVYKEVHQKREEEFSSSEKHANDRISTTMGLYWEKKNIPSALLSLIERLK